MIWSWLVLIAKIAAAIWLTHGAFAGVDFIRERDRFRPPRFRQPLVDRWRRFPGELGIIGLGALGGFWSVRQFKRWKQAQDEALNAEARSWGALLNRLARTTARRRRLLAKGLGLPPDARDLDYLIAKVCMVGGPEQVARLHRALDFLEDLDEFSAERAARMAQNPSETA